MHKVSDAHSFKNVVKLNFLHSTLTLPMSGTVVISLMLFVVTLSGVRSPLLPGKLLVLVGIPMFRFPL